MALQDMVLWSLALVARGVAIPFLKELPSSGHAVSSASSFDPSSFWETESWKAFEQWAQVSTLEVCQGSLGHAWLAPVRLGTNLSLSHLEGLPRQGGPIPKPDIKEKEVRWSVGLKKEIVEALAGKVKGPTIEELDAAIAQAKTRLSSGSSDDQRSNSSLSDLPSAPSQPSGHLALDEIVPPGVQLNALSAAQREEWRSHILRGHLPYRRDCKYCVEGSGLGVQHRRIRNPQAFSLSVDLFGPMSGAERGRDEQSVSGNPHLKFGLVGVFRLPKTAVELHSPPSHTPTKDYTAGDEGNPADDVAADDELAEYEPSLPGDFDDDLFAELRNIPLTDDVQILIQYLRLSLSTGSQVPRHPSTPPPDPLLPFVGYPCLMIELTALLLHDGHHLSREYSSAQRTSHRRNHLGGMAHIYQTPYRIQFVDTLSVCPM